MRIEIDSNNALSNAISGASEGVKFWRDANVFLGAAPSFELEILGMCNAKILPILRNVRETVAPSATPVTVPLCIQ